MNLTLTGIDYPHPYLADRGIAKETAIEFGVGFYSGPGLMRDRLVIPIHNADGQLNATGDPVVANPTPKKWFNTSVFATAAPYTSRTNLIVYDGLVGPHYLNWDGVLARTPA